MSVYDDIDDKWGYFYALLRECLDKFLPLKKVTSQKSKRPTSWFNDKILEQIKLKNKANEFLRDQDWRRMALYVRNTKMI